MGLFDFFRPRSQPTGGPLLPAPQGPLDAQGKAAEETAQGTPPTDTFVDLPVTAMGRWNLQRIRVALDNHQMGMFADSAMLVEAMMGSGRVQTALNGRLKGITMRHLHVKPIDDSADAKEAALWTEWLWQTVLTDEVLDQQMAWTVLEGFSLSQRCWYTREARGETVWCPKLQPWHPQFIYYDVMRRQYVAQTAEGIEYIDSEDPQWWLFTPWGEYRGWLRGALRSCAVPWAVASYALRDAGRFSEVHGLPTKVIKAPAQANATDKSRMTGAVRGMGNSTTLFLPQQTGPEGTGWDVSLLEARDRSWESFFALMEKCDREIQQVIRGTNLTSEVQGGSYAAAQVHADEDSGYADSDCRKLIESFRSTVQMFLGYNFGWADKCPVMWMEAPDKPDILALAQAQQFAMMTAKQAGEMGWELDAHRYAERFGMPLVRVNEESKQVTIPLAPTDVAKTVRVDESRQSIGLAPLGDERGDLLIAELEDYDADEPDDPPPKDPDQEAAE